MMNPMMMPGMEQNHYPMFSIPLFHFRYPGDLEAIKNGVRSLVAENGESPVNLSNEGGYHSKMDLYEKDFMLPLTQWIAEQSGYAYATLGIDKDVTSFEGMWFNINSAMHNHNQMHQHSGILSGVFYLNTPEGSGDIHFYNIGFNQNWEGYGVGRSTEFTTFEHSIEVGPDTQGMLYLFPSYVYHSVGTNKKDVERMSISFNMR